MKITPKKLKVLTLIARGYTDKEIAHSMQISTRTIHSHISSILSILNATNRVNAVYLYKDKHPNWKI
ncbi:MAG: response regulator transcription factor [Candidatus Gastranaerophilaceae bacterium]